MGVVTTVGAATTIALIAMILSAISLGTDHWIEYTVNRDALKGIANGQNSVSLNTSIYHDPIYFSRNRGLFRTCFLGPDTYFLAAEEYQDDVIDTTCLMERGFNLRTEPVTISWGRHYKTRAHLMRTHVGVMAAGILLLMVSVFLGAAGCWLLGGVMVRNAGIICFFAALMLAAAIAVFHGYEYLERQKINQKPFPKFWANTEPLQSVANWAYGWSYVLAILGFGMALIAAILFLCAGCMLAEIRYEEKHPLPEPKHKRRHRPASRAYDMIDSSASLPPAYDYSQFQMPTALPAVQFPAVQYPAAQYPAAPVSMATPAMAYPFMNTGGIYAT